MFSKSYKVIGLVTLTIVLGATGCSDSSNTAKVAPVVEVSQIEVSKWGPHGTTAGQAFNIQPNGASAIWFESTWTGTIDNLEVWFGDQKLGEVGMTSGKGMSAIIPLTLLMTPKIVPIHLINKTTGQKVDVGVFEITPGRDAEKKSVVIEGKAPVEDQLAKKQRLLMEMSDLAAGLQKDNEGMKRELDEMSQSRCYRLFRYLQRHGI